jgi:hypothetical protein
MKPISESLQARLGPAICAAALLASGCATHDNATSTGPGPLPACAAAASTVTLAPGAYARYDIATDSGCAVFPSNASGTDSAEYLVVVQAAGGAPGDSAHYQVEAGVAGPVAAAAAPPSRPSVATAFDRFRHAREARLARGAAAFAPLPRRPGAAAVTPPTAGSLRSFSVCSDVTCSTYTTVWARALSVGAHVALYEDTLAPPNGLSAADIDSLSTIFDQRVYPLDTLAFGRESDVDSNGVVIALLTPVVNRLVTAAECDTAGYVTGFFDAVDLDPLTTAQHNHGEVFYGMVPDPSGALSCPHSSADVALQLPVTFAHEFEHMINFVQHVLVRGGAPEDDWLDEGLAKYAEELTADSYLPGDSATWDYDVVAEFYDAYQYLSAPERHFLLTTSDQSLADVGAGWLFVRYLVDQMGVAIAPKLVQTALTGTANVAAQTGLSFGALDERWALANWVSDLPGFNTPGELRYTTWPMRTVFENLYLTDAQDFPRSYPLVPAIATPGTLDLAGSLRAGSGVYLRVLQRPGGGPDTLHVNAGGSPVPASLAPQFAVIRIR